MKMRLTRGKKRALSRLLSEKQKLVNAINPILTMMTTDNPHPMGQQCEQVCHAATLLEDAIREALLVVTCPQIRTILHNSEVAVVRIRSEVSGWKGGGSFPINIDTLLTQILPAELLQTDEFLEISEAEALDHEHEQVPQVPLMNRMSRQQDLIYKSHSRSLQDPLVSEPLVNFPHQTDHNTDILCMSPSRASSTASSRSSRSTICQSRQSPRVVQTADIYNDDLDFSVPSQFPPRASHAGSIFKQRTGETFPPSSRTSRTSSVTSSSRSSRQTVRETSLKQVKAEQDFLREEEMIEEELSKLRLKKLEEEAVEEMNAKRQEIEARKRKLKYEEQERMFERRRRELELKCEEDCLSAQVEGSIASSRSIRSGKSISSQLGYPKTSNEAAQSFRSRCSDTGYENAPNKNFDLFSHQKLSDRELVDIHQPQLSMESSRMVPLTPVKNEYRDCNQTDFAPGISGSKRTQNRSPHAQANISRTSHLEHYSETKTMSLQQHSGLPTVETGHSSHIPRQPLTEVKELNHPSKSEEIQTQLLHNLESMVTETTMPSLTVQKFDGNPAKYTSFMRSFDDLIASKIRNPTRLLAHLINCCIGEALERVEGLTILEPEEGYKEARAVLKLHYGQPHIVARSMLDGLLNSESIEKDRSIPLGKKLLTFSSKMQNVYNTMKALNSYADVNSWSTISQLVAKLPVFGVNSWKKEAAVIYSQGREPTLIDFIQFVKNLAERECHAYSNVLSLKQKQNQSKEPQKSHQGNTRITTTIHAASGKVDATDNDPPKQPSHKNNCSYCDSNHPITICPVFKALKLPDRLNYVKKQMLCFNCLKKGHKTTDCRFDSNCPIDECTNKHHGLLHFAERNVDTSSSSIGAGIELNNENIDISSSSIGVGVEHSTDITASTAVGNDTTGAGDDTTGAGDDTTGAGDGLAEGRSITQFTNQCHLKMTPKKVSLGILPVVIKSKGHDKSIQAYAFLDDGSDSVLFLESLLERLGVSEATTTATATMRSETLHGVEFKSCLEHEFTIEALDGSDSVECVGYSRETLNVGRRNIPTAEEINRFSHLKNVPYSVLDDKQVYILIGTSVPEAHWVFESRYGRRKEPFAVRGPLGWTFKGPMGNTKKYIQSLNHVQTDYCQEDVQVLLKRMIDLDFNEHGNPSTAMSVEDKIALTKIEKSTVTLSDGRFQVDTPFRDGGETILDSHTEQAYQGTLKRMMWLKKRFLKDARLFEKYKDGIMKLKDIPHVRVIPSAEINHTSGWYLPHHPAVHPQKPGKIRIVLDCAATFAGTSLNDQLLQGPDLNNSLIGVNLRFRQEEHATIADIEGMFHQVQLPPYQRKYFRTLWFVDNDLNNDVEELEFMVHVFGAKPSPCVATHTLRLAAETYGTCEGDKKLVETVQKEFYVDDMAASRAASENHANCVNLVTRLPEILHCAGFHLTKFASNCPFALEALPPEERAMTMKQVDLSVIDGSSQPNAVEKTLGVGWNIPTDELLCRVVKPSGPPVRKTVLSTLSQVFNPDGLAGPFLLPARKLFQELTHELYRWDEEFEGKHLKVWTLWINELSQLVHLRIPRCFKPPEFGRIVSTQLHVFADAALKEGYGAVAYLRFQNEEGKIHVSFVMAKSRVVPMKPVSTTPKLELVACTVAAKLAKLITSELTIPIDSITYWTDSTTVLQYLRDCSKRFPIFEANRLQLIQALTLISSWRHIPSEENPADIASRGLSMSQTAKVKIWIHCSDFLWYDESCWPVDPVGLLQLPPEISDARLQEVAAFAQNDSVDQSVFLQIISSVSSWKRLCKIFSWLARVQKNASLTYKNQSSEALKEPLTTQDIEQAVVNIAKVVQAESFPTEFVQYSAAIDPIKPPPPVKMKLPCSSKLRKVDPIMFPYDGVLRVDTRMQHTDMLFDTQYPIIMPPSHHATKLMIIHYHLLVIHLGPSSVLSAVSEKFWIVGGHNYVRKIMGKCFKCKVRNQAPESQVMAPLPAFRVTVGGFPFEHTGLDYFGYFIVKRGRANVKRWGCLFTCMKTRAIHIEVAHSLDSDSFLCALIRFVARRGAPMELYSDNGTNFVGAKSDALAAMERWNHDKIRSELLDQGTNWHFGTPECSHANGVWERMIRTVRQVLFHLANEQSLTDETLSTFFAEAEKVINDRPIVKLSSDNAFSTLTPNHLLLRRRNPSVSPEESSTNAFYRAHWKQANYLATVFWNRWLKEYLPQLRLRQKWHMPQRNIQVGDLVLLVERCPRGEWPKAIVEEVFPGTDGVVRKVLVRTAKSTYTRDVRKLCLLEGAE